MKIIFILPFLSGIGGIQSSLLNIMRTIDRKDNQIYICVLSNFISDKTVLPDNITLVKSPKILEYSLRPFKASLLEYNLHERVAFIAAKIIKRVFGYQLLLRIVCKFHRVKEQFDVGVSYTNDIHTRGFVGGSNLFTIECVNAKRKIGWIHNEPKKHGFTSRTCKRTYKDFDAIVNVSSECKKEFDQLCPEYQNKSFVVNNIVDPDHILFLSLKQKATFGNTFNILTVARIENGQKRIDRLIDAALELSNLVGSRFKWSVIGDGPDLSFFRDMVVKRGLEKFVVFLGRMDNPYPFIKNAQVVVLTSDYEAYSMVLIESLTLGVPVISTDYNSAKEIVEDSKNGFIVKKDPVEIAKSIKKLMDDKDMYFKIKEEISMNCSRFSSLDSFWYVIKHE